MVKAYSKHRGARCAKNLPFNDESVDFIYSSHLIEHLRKDEAKSVLRECLRVLKRDGLIRLSIPDLQLMARNYLEQVEDIQNNREKYGYLPSERFLEILGMPGKTTTPFVLKIFSSGEHKWMYDQLSLTELLTSCGFTDVLKRSYKVGQMPDIEFLDTRPEHTLYLEARKPSAL